MKQLVLKRLKRWRDCVTTDDWRTTNQVNHIVVLSKKETWRIIHHVQGVCTNKYYNFTTPRSYFAWMYCWWLTKSPQSSSLPSEAIWSRSCIHSWQTSHITYSWLHRRRLSFSVIKTHALTRRIIKTLNRNNCFRDQIACPRRISISLIRRRSFTSLNVEVTACCVETRSIAARFPNLF